MGVETTKSKLSEFIARACRLPRDVAGRVGNLSDSLSKERLKAIPSQNNIPYKYLTVAIILLLYLPWMISLTYVIPPQVEITFGNEVDSESYCSVISSSEVGVTHAVLLNTTPFSFNGDWEVNLDYFWMREYDFNSYGRNDSDGYHFTFSKSDFSVIVLERRMQIPIANYSELTVSVDIEGILGAAGIYFEVFADNQRAVQEADILPSNITKVNVTAPLGAARIVSNSWLSTIVCRLHIGLTEGAHVKLRGIVIDAEFTGKMSRVQFDIKSTDNSSLYENPYMKYTDYAPRVAIVQNNDSDSASIYFPNRMKDELYLPPGTYEGVTFWNLNNQDSPDPTNSSLWVPNVSFVVIENTTLEVDLGLFTKRIDYDISPSVLLNSMTIVINNDYWYAHSAKIIGSTLYSDIPDFLYVPGTIDSLTISIWIWSPLSPRRGWGWGPSDRFRILKETTFGLNNNSMNLLLSVTLPYTAIGGVLFGIGELVILTFIALLVAGFIISMRTALRYSDLRNRLSDSRILPLLMLSASIFLPWSMQFAQSVGPGFDGVSWISWFSMPFMIRWTDTTAIQLLLSVPDWWYATLISTIFLFIPLFYGYLSLSSTETKQFNRTFALALFLPYLVVLSAFNFSAINLDTISIGPIVALAALPVWLLRLGLRKLKITT